MSSKRINTLAKLPQRDAASHKGSYGKVLVIAGSRDMAGAAALTCNAAMRCGSGLVKAATVGSIQQTLITLAVNVTTARLPEDENGRIHEDGKALAVAWCGEHDAAAIGPGLGQSDGLVRLMADIVGQVTCPLVIDADGLNNLCRAGREVLPLNDKTVLTPHPGEMTRLWKSWVGKPLPDCRATQAEELAVVCGATVILKGHETVVSNGRETYINTTGNAGMATAGSGDVLTGCVMSLLGQGLSPMAAGALAVYIHGAAGDFAAECTGMISMTATDILEHLSVAWQEYQAGIMEQ